MKKITALPHPRGPFRVGRIHLNFIDEKRVDPFPPANGKNRDIPVMIWYPGNDRDEKSPLKLLNSRDLASLKHYVLYKIIPNRICDIATNSYEDIALSPKSSQFPVLIFNHGFSSYLQQNTILMEHLASSGYIVVSVGHPYDGVASYPDGRSIPLDLESVENLSKKARRNQAAFNTNIRQLARQGLSLEEMKNYTENYLQSSQPMNAKVELWVEDIRFIADVLEQMNEGLIPSRFAHRLALEKGIGVFGQSYGGAAAVLACCLDERLTAALNMDGAMYGGLRSKYKYRKPTMYMDSDMFPGRTSYFFQINEEDTYSVMVKGSKHLDYSDYTYILKSWPLKLMQLLGRIDGSLMIEITNAYVRAFFDRYIKQIDAPLLEQNPYRQVVFEKRRSLNSAPI